MHLTCTNMTRAAIREALTRAKHAGVQNIMALRGDPPKGARWARCADGFEHAVDLVKFIHDEFGDYFGIVVAGYPEGHPESGSYEEDLCHLKAKVDAGASMIVTQLFYDVERCLSFIRDCRSAGILCPILPGKYAYMLNCAGECVRARVNTALALCPYAKGVSYAQVSCQSKTTKALSV